MTSRRSYRGTLAMFFALAALFALGGCQEEQRVNVDCRGDDSGTFIGCQVKHTQGNARVKACFELHFTCANGTKSVGSGCQEVGPGATAEHRIPVEALSNFKDCDKAVSTEIKNLSLTGL
jgi:hypothetical protein